MKSNLNFPAQLFRYPKDEKHRWELVDELYAKCGVSDATPLNDEISRIDSTTAICRDNGKGTESFEWAPVYRLGQYGQISVATGLIFVTFAEGVSLEQVEERLKEAGFVVDNDSPDVGAWLRHESGSIKAALENYPAIICFKQILTAEPQFLMQRASKRGKF